jgi:hypothetical protein
MLRGGGVMTILCYYCGHTSRSMMEATRHDADRPESCLAEQQPTKTHLRTMQAAIGSILQTLTVQGEGNLELALDAYHERIEPVYR